MYYKRFQIKWTLVVIAMLILSGASFFFLPAIISISSVGKEYFTEDKSNITKYLRSGLIATIGSAGILNEVKAVASFINSESNNKNTNKIITFDSSLPVEDSEQRRKTQKNQQGYEIQEINLANIPNHTPNPETLELRTADNSKYYETSKKRNLSLETKIELDRIIDSKTLNGISFWGDVPVQASPLFSDDILYFVTRENSVVAQNFKTGELIFNLRFLEPPARRGMVLWESRDKNSKVLYFYVSSFLVAVDAMTGERVKNFGANGYKKLGYGTAAPHIFQDSILAPLNNPPSVVSLDRLSGAVNWITPLIKNGDSMKDGAAPWGGSVLDHSKGIIFLTTSNPKPGVYGGERPGNNNYANSLLALNAYTGKVIWSLQDVHHDLWDLDAASPPALGVYNGPSGPVDVVFAPTKRGSLLVVERISGNLINTFSYRKAPISSIPGEKTAPFQPVFDFPEPFLEQEFTFDDIRNDVLSSESFDIQDYNFGFFEPPSLDKTLILYGLHGGATWPGVSIDKSSNQLLILVNRLPWKIRMFLQSGDLSNSGKEDGPEERLYLKKCSVCHGNQRNGFYQSPGELEKNIVPSLVGVKYTNAMRVMNDLSLFNNRHENMTISGADLSSLSDWFQKKDTELEAKGLMDLHYLWSMFMDDQGLPINKPPYGELVSYDLESLKINWRIPVGDYKPLLGANSGMPIQGGGMATTSNGIVFVTGTPDNFVRAFDTDDGALLWEYEMSAAGSSPPIVFQSSGSDYLAVVATGGKFSGYSAVASKIYIFKL